MVYDIQFSVSTKKAIKVYDENEDYAEALMIFIETEVPEEVKIMFKK